MSDSKKQYGLILPKKGSQDVIQRPSIFDDNSDDSEDSGPGESDWRKKAYQREAAKSGEKRQTKIQIQKALSEDPSIYQYDEVYDNMKDTTSKQSSKTDDKKKQSRYIQSLKRNAERRKLENERRLERQVQKERIEEGEQFKDKETFVTTAYKNKLEEFKKLEEQEKRMDMLEEIGDVTKQKDISGFYRHLYRTTVDVSKNADQGSSKEKETEEESKNLEKKGLSPALPVKEEVTAKPKRQYRKRTRSGSSKEEGENTTSSSSSSSESEDENKVKMIKSDDKKKINSPEKSKMSNILEKENDKQPVNTKEIKGKEEPKLEAEEEKPKIELKSEEKVIKETKPAVNIWLKRTVGTQFDAALKRYLERKANRQCAF